MTKEDAIEIIKSECYVFNPLNFDRSTMVNTALDMAVKALKQEPKPMVEIDLDYVIKQKYIEREVLDKIRAEIQNLRDCSCSCSDGIIDDVEDIIDKYKAESEG